MKLTEVQELAVQALIGSHIGHEEFDRFFIGMECGSVVDGNFVLFVHNEYYNQYILRQYASIIGRVVSRVTGEPIDTICVASIDIEGKADEAIDRYLKTPR